MKVKEPRTERGTNLLWDSYHFLGLSFLTCKIGRNGAELNGSLL